jgi:hypothetical protein
VRGSASDESERSIEPIPVFGHSSARQRQWRRFFQWGPAFNQYVSNVWKAHMLKPAVKAGDRTITKCLGVSDFYSVHFTTYFLADSSESAGGATGDMSKYDEFCDRVSGTGKVIFSVTLMEKEARGGVDAKITHAGISVERRERRQRF